MRNTIKMTVTINNEIWKNNIKSEIVVMHMLFTDYDHLFNADQWKEDVKEALKMSKNFTMVTIDLYSYNSNDYYSRNDKQILAGRRYTNNYSELKRAVISNANIFSDWNPAVKSQIFEDLKEVVEIGNRAFINLLKEKVTE